MRKRILIVVAIALVPTLGAAQQKQKQFELTPAIGYQFGGDFDVDDPFVGLVRVDVADSVSYGLTFDIPVSRSLQIELFYARQPTTLRADQGLFVPSLPLGEVDLSYFHAGVLWQSAAGQIRPFALGSLGMTEIDADLPGVDNDYRFSMSLGGGVKFLFTETIGLRLDGRFLITAIDDTLFDHQYYCCGGPSSELTQFLVSTGLIFAF